MSTRQHQYGPWPRAEAARAFLVETLLCVVLLAAIVALALEARHEVLAGPAIGGLAAGIVAIVRHRKTIEPGAPGSIDTSLVRIPRMPGIEEPIVIEYAAPPGHAETVADVVVRAGFDIDVVSRFGHRGVGEFPWLVQVHIEGTMGNFFPELEAQGFATFSALLRDIWMVRDANGDGQLELVDVEGTRIILPPSLPDSAIEALKSTDWSEISGGCLIWAADHRKWVDRTHPE